MGECLERVYLASVLNECIERGHWTSVLSVS